MVLSMGKEQLTLSSADKEKLKATVTIKTY